MSATANSTSLFPYLPYSALCPWLTITTVVHLSRSRLTVEHEGATQSFEVTDLAANFATAFAQAHKIKREMVLAQQVFDELSGKP